MSIGVGLSPQTRSFRSSGLLFLGLTSPPPRTKSVEPPLLTHGVGWFMSLALGFGTFASQKTELKVSCHSLRHTMATQLLNADAALVTIQDLLGHGQITTTQRYCRVSNLKVQRDYYKAIEVVMQRTQSRENDKFELEKYG